MRLWHEDLLFYLPRQQLLGQHRECCALRGKGWGRKHSTVDYVFRHPYSYLFLYHQKVMDEMEKRGYHPEKKWRNASYRGKNSPTYQELFLPEKRIPIYPEHNSFYYQECLKNLAKKGVLL